MADDLDDDLEDEIDEELDEELDEEELDEDELGEEDLDADIDDEFAEGDEPEAEEEEEAAAPERPAARKRREDGEEEDEEEELGPDDVEADLDTILRDRIAAGEDDEEDEEEEQVDTRAPGETADGVAPRRANEFVCTGCFLLVNRAQFGSLDNLQCPVGDSDCPSIAEIRRAETGGRPAPRAAKKAPAKKAAQKTSAKKAPAKKAAKAGRRR